MVATAGPVTIDRDGKILVVRTPRGYALGTTVVLERLRRNGAPDSSFGRGGAVATDFGSKYGAGAAAAAVQPDGKVVVFGRSASDPPVEVKYDPDAFDLVLARYLPNGRLDRTFGAAGKVVTSVDRDFAAGAIGPDGKIVAVVSSVGPSASREPKLVRYRSDGRLDPSFGTGGLVASVEQEEPYLPAEAALQGDGKIVVAVEGEYGPMGESRTIILRHLPNGRVDSSFGSGRKYTNPYGHMWVNAVVNENFVANQVTVQSDGKVLLAGSSSDGFELIRYTADGTLDESFGSGGRVVEGFSAVYPGWASALAIQRDGKIVAGGTTAESGAFVLVRYMPDGQRDASFGEGGKAVNRSLRSAGALALQNDGKIVVYTASSKLGSVLIRYTADGKLDKSFGDDGTVAIPASR